MRAGQFRPRRKATVRFCPNPKTIWKQNQCSRMLPRIPRRSPGSCGTTIQRNESENRRSNHPNRIGLPGDGRRPSTSTNANSHRAWTIPKRNPSGSWEGTIVRPSLALNTPDEPPFRLISIPEPPERRPLRVTNRPDMPCQER